LSPNTEKDDLHLNVRALFRPGKWKKGEKTEVLEEKFESFLGINHTCAFNSGRSGLLAILKSLNFKAGDEILLQAFTCNAAVNPILWEKLKPVFVDIEENSLNMNPEDLEKKIGPKSRAVIVQHTFGQPTDLKRIIDICTENNLILIEDCAHSLGADYEFSEGETKKIGTLGKVSFFSFGRDKVISSVFGGMTATDDPVLGERIRKFEAETEYPSNYWIFQQLLHPPLTRKLIIPLYEYHELGRFILIALQKLSLLSKAVHKKEKISKKPDYIPLKMSNILSKLALNQFDKLKRLNSHRREIAEFYYQELENSEFILPEKDPNRIYMRFPILVGNTDKILREGRKYNIFLDDGWRKSPVVPPDTSLEEMGYSRGSCPVAERVADEIVNLPTHINISEEKAKRVINLIKKFEI